MQGSGDGSMRGIIPRAMQQVGLYKTQLENKGWVYNMEVSFVEIYNETIRVNNYIIKIAIFIFIIINLSFSRIYLDQIAKKMQSMKLRKISMAIRLFLMLS